MERCQRGPLALLGKQMVGKPARGFKSLTLRQFNNKPFYGAVGERTKPSGCKPDSHKDPHVRIDAGSTNLQLAL